MAVSSASFRRIASPYLPESSIFELPVQIGQDDVTTGERTSGVM